MFKKITTSEAMKIAGVTRVTIISWIEDFEIGYKLGGRWTVFEDGLRMILSGKLHYSYKYKKDEKRVNKTYKEMIQE